ncbi:hypothetical protein ACP4OV_016872 [Aristida adscensionis]
MLTCANNALDPHNIIGFKVNNLTWVYDRIEKLKGGYS